MFNGSNCVRKSQLSEILTEPLNPRAPPPGKKNFATPCVNYTSTRKSQEEKVRIQ